MMGIYVLYIIPLVLIQTIIGAPELNFNVDKTRLEFETGESISLRCFITGTVDNPTLEWYDNNDAVVANRDTSVNPYVMTLNPTTLLLYLGEATKDMSGNYKCKATTGEGLLEKEIRIDVRAALTFENCPNEQFGIYAEASTITCKATGNAFTYWTRSPSFPSTGDNYKKDLASVWIKNTSMSDEGDYTYHAMADEQTKIRTIKFSVYTKPEIVQPILQTTAVVGGEASLFCKAKGIPDPEIEWKKGPTIIRTTDRIEVTQTKEGDDVQGEIKISKVIKEDAAEYTCTAKNLASKAGDIADRTTGNLIVHIPPTIESADDVQGKEGGAASLECLARGDPPPNIIFVKVATNERFAEGTSQKDITVTQKDITVPSNLGSMLTLSFLKLKHSDAGEYRCEAQNIADTANTIVNLEVQYKPNFDDQGPTTFYNWAGNQDAYLKCIANGNPLPAFVWSKGGNDIEAGDPYHVVENENLDPEKPQTAVSKLRVTFTGNNEAVVFGEYTCMATNLQGDSKIPLLMKRAEAPGEPTTIAIFKEDARHIVFRLDGPTVKGPDVTFYKVVYKVKGSTDEAKTIQVAKEYRDFIDDSRKYTTITVEDLLPNTDYVFTFYAINAVDDGAPRELNKRTNPISKPEVPKIDRQTDQRKPTSIVVNWEIPSDGGSQILEYKISYQRVTVKKNGSSDSMKDYDRVSKFGSEQVFEGIKDSPYTIRNLIPDTFYEVTVAARNEKGYSLPGSRIMKTAIGEPEGLSTAAIIGIVIGIFFLLFIIVDVTCYFKNNCGILMSIREKVGGGREEGYAVAKTEDVENLAKKDELTEEVKAAEEGELAEAHEDEKKEPLLSEEQKVDTVDEGKPEEKKELEPEEKEAAKTEQTKIESPKTEQAPSETPAKEEIPAADEQPSTDKTDKPQE